MKRKVWADWQRLDDLAQRHGGKAVNNVPIEYVFPSIERATAFKRELESDSVLKELFYPAIGRSETVLLWER